MNSIDLVRASRDGDQFHYLWAARQCLKLLDSRSGLDAVSIEGSSIEDSVKEGDEIIDVGLYYGGQSLDSANKIKYYQLKHSTFRRDKNWTLGEIGETLKVFVRQYQEIIEQYGLAFYWEKIKFIFLTNRPISSRVEATFSDIKNNEKIRYKKDYERFKKKIGLQNKENIANFLQVLEIKGKEDCFLEQRALLNEELADYLVRVNRDLSSLIERLIARKATTEFSNNPVITKIDLLRILNIDEDELYPSPNFIRLPQNLITRNQQEAIIADIVKRSDNLPTVIHADGGVGKTVFITQISNYINDKTGSISIVYDCFANGSYRNRRKFRHRHRDGLVQIINELSGRGLCHPIIPQSSDDTTSFLKGFYKKINESLATLQSINDQAKIFIFIDAADNAQMAALENNESDSFVNDLLIESLTFPQNIHLIISSRTHRRKLLKIPPNTPEYKLLPFIEEETEQALKKLGVNISRVNLLEFHRLTSGNPRVQALALDRYKSVEAALSYLGPEPETSEDTIQKILNETYEKLLFDSPNLETESIISICEAIALFRPLIPLSFLTRLTGIEESAIMSFGVDFGRSIRITEGALQFYDEPTETWFRDSFRIDKDKLKSIVQKLKELVPESSYAATMLPELMFKVGEYEELIRITLFSENLPDNKIDRQEIELQRLVYAFKAALSQKSYKDATKIALKAGGEYTGDGRRIEFIKNNLPLASQFMSIDQAQDLAASKKMKGEWQGSHYLYNASLFSNYEELRIDALSNLRMMENWLFDWSKLSSKEREKQPVKVYEIAEYFLTQVSLGLIDDAITQLLRWKLNDIHYKAGLLVAEKLITLKKYSVLVEIIKKAEKSILLVLAINEKLAEIGKFLSKELLESMLDNVISSLESLPKDRGIESSYLATMTAFIESCLLKKIDRKNDFITILQRYYKVPSYYSYYDPNRGIKIQTSILWLYLNGQTAKPHDLISDEEIKEALKKDSSYNPNVREFKETAGFLLPWYQLRLRVIVEELASKDFLEALEMLPKIHSNNQFVRELLADVVRLFIDFMLLRSLDTEGILKCYQKNYESGGLYTRSLLLWMHYIVHSNNESLEGNLYDYAEKVCQQIKNEDATHRVEEYINLTKAFFSFDKAEAKEYFNEALTIASEISDENFNRWSSLLYLAEASQGLDDNPQLAYDFARAAEVSYQYVDREKHFEYSETARAITYISPSSSLAILSRWNERQVWASHRHNYQVQEVISLFVKKKNINPQGFIAFIPYLGVDFSILTCVLDAITDRKIQQNIVEYFYLYFSKEEHSLSDWEKLINIVEGFSLTVPSDASKTVFQLKEIKNTDKTLKEIESRKRLELLPLGKQREFTTPRNSGVVRDYKKLFSDVDISDYKSIASAYFIYREDGYPCDFQTFFSELLNILKPELSVIFSVLSGLLLEIQKKENITGLFFIKDIICALEESDLFNSSRKSTRSELKESLLMCVGTFADKLDLSEGYYEQLPYEKIEELCDITQKDVYRTAIEKIEKSSFNLNSESFFRISRLLSTQLNKNEAREVFQFGIDWFDKFLDEEVADGSWNSTLQPPQEVEKNVAGYIWARLASPDSRIRWQMAHVVRGLVYFDQKIILDELVKFAQKENSIRPFIDQKFYFYELHALQWFLIALNRSIQDNVQCIAYYFEFLLEISLNSKHAMICEITKNIIIKLDQFNAISLDQETLSKVTKINVSQLNIGDSLTRPVTEKIERVYGGFFPDIGPYWLKPLRRLFIDELSQEDIENLALKYMRDDLELFSNHNLPGSEKKLLEDLASYSDNKYIQDVRGLKKIYDYFKTRHSHGSYPEIDDLNFYGAYHAMMLTASYLLKYYPLKSKQEDVISWLHYSHGLVNNNGFWLSDYRNAKPFNECSWKSERISDEKWASSTLYFDFERVLGIGSSVLRVWGSWTSLFGFKRENINITSALVSPNRSLSLLHALENVENYMDYRIPEYEDSLEINSGDFQMRGWIKDSYNDPRLDSFDPWSGGISNHLLKPAQFVIDKLQLKSDELEKHWYSDNEELISWNEIWGEKANQHTQDVEQGNRLHFRFSELCDLLEKIDFDLIVQVSITRDILEKEYDYRKKRETITKLFLIKSNGRILTI